VGTGGCMVTGAMLLSLAVLTLALLA